MKPKLRVGSPPEATERRTVTLTLAADEATLQRLAALLLFSDVSAPPPKPENVEWVEPVLFEEREEVRDQVRDWLHSVATERGLDIAKGLLAWVACPGIGKATDEHLALLRHMMREEQKPDGSAQ